jgi:uncharacterized protein
MGKRWTTNRLAKASLNQHRRKFRASLFWNSARKVACTSQDFRAKPYFIVNIQLFWCTSPVQKSGAFSGLPGPLRLWYNGIMDKQDILARLKENEAALKARGVTHAALFGSRARGDNRPDSDIDIMIDIDPEAPIGLWEYAGLKHYIASLFDGPVDVIDRGALKPYVRPPAEGDAVYAF